MRNSVSVLLLLITGSAFAYERDPFMNPWIVVADSVDLSVPAGTCVVTGVASYYSRPVAGATVATFNRSWSGITDSTGKYTFSLHEKDSAIFFYHPSYEEILIRNYDFKSQHRVTINFYARDKYEQHQMMKKPVIYLYSDVETEVILSVRCPNITFIYPFYQESWHVKTQPNGGLTDVASGKEFPYLFWEGESKLRYDHTSGIVTGSIVATDTLVPFFENSLSAMGLTGKEQADFITFWAPQLVQKKYVFIQFLAGEQYNEMIAGIDVWPLPDAQRRIFMNYTLLDDPVVDFKFQAQSFSSFERKGLTLVEWGGGEIPFDRMTN